MKREGLFPFKSRLFCSPNQNSFLTSRPHRKDQISHCPSTINQPLSQDRRLIHPSRRHQQQTVHHPSHPFPFSFSSSPFHHNLPLVRDDHVIQVQAVLRPRPRGRESGEAVTSHSEFRKKERREERDRWDRGCRIKLSIAEIT